MLEGKLASRCLCQQLCLVVITAHDTCGGYCWNTGPQPPAVPFLRLLLLLLMLWRCGLLHSRLGVAAAVCHAVPHPV